MITSKECIVVNATALDKSGALGILTQFIENIPEDDHQWLIFISPLVKNLSQKRNMEVVPIENVKGLARRFMWDSFGLKRWLNRHGIVPVGSISLQNTGFNTGYNVPQVVYYHQSIPFYPYRWSPVYNKERGLWFYKNIYPFFVKRYLKSNTRVIVQLESIKTGFAKRFNHPLELIGVFSPTVQKPLSAETMQDLSDLKSDNINLFYPATPVFYKNHSVLYKCMEKLDSGVRLFLTIDRNEVATKDERIIASGMHPYEWVCAMYDNCDALVFPSYIETYGLPLIEAAMTGLPIIAADLPYAHEVLKDYEGAVFVKYDSPDEWASAVKRLKKGERHSPLDVSNRPGWKEFFKETKIIFKNR